MTIKQHFIVVGLEFESNIIGQQLLYAIKEEKNVVLLKLLPTEVEVSSGYYVTGPDQPVEEPQEKTEIHGAILYYRVPGNIFERLGKPTLGDTVTISLQVSSQSSSVISFGGD